MSGEEAMMKSKLFRWGRSEEFNVRFLVHNGQNEVALPLSEFADLVMQAYGLLPCESW